MSACYDEINTIQLSVIPPPPPPPPLPTHSMPNPNYSLDDTKDCHGYSLVKKVRRPTPIELSASTSAINEKKDEICTSQPHETLEMDFLQKPTLARASPSLPDLSKHESSSVSKATDVAPPLVDTDASVAVKDTTDKPSGSERGPIYSLSSGKGNSYSSGSANKEKDKMDGFSPAEYEEVQSMQANRGLEKMTRKSPTYDSLPPSSSSPLPLEESLYSNISGKQSEKAPSGKPYSRTKSEIRTKKKPLLAAASVPMDSQPRTARRSLTTTGTKAEILRKLTESGVVTKH